MGRKVAGRFVRCLSKIVGAGKMREQTGRSLFFLLGMLKAFLRAPTRFLSTHRTCWNCDYLPTKPSEPSLQCRNCDAPQPPTVSYFAAFNLPPTYRLPVTPAQLRLQYHQLQQKLHPDRASRSSEGYREWIKKAEDASSFINEAYSTLKDPLKRAIYLLEQSGQTVNETDKAEDQDFLITWMDRREILADGSDRDARGAVCRDVENEVDHVIKLLEQHFSAQSYKQAQQETIRLRYLMQLQRICQQSRE
jgi:molecular chaperone HscB